jgi:hypothetical protein
MAENIINKLTVKSVFGKIPTITVKTTDPVTKEVVETKVLEKDLHLMRIYGQATGYRIATTQYGDSSVFKGVFKAVRPDTGEISTAGECCLPKSVENQLATILNSADGAEFAFDVWAIPASNGYGYEYRVKSVPGVDVAPAPVILALEGKMGMLQLAAPSESEEAAPKASKKK